MAATVAILRNELGQLKETLACQIGEMWSSFKNQRSLIEAEWQELRDYLYATDTSSTSNAALPWKNSTTLPKLTQLLDNLHANYSATMFPNDNWFRWEAYEEDDASREKVQAIEAYMSNKVRESGFIETASELLYDFIQYGSAFAEVQFVSEIYEGADGLPTRGYVGPRAFRISPYDIVFNPLAPNFQSSPKIVRKLLSIGEIARLAKNDVHWEKAYKKCLHLRSISGSTAKSEDFNKAAGLSVDGFGSYTEYLNSGHVELLTFYGDLYDPHARKLYENSKIQVIDRCLVVSDSKIENWMGKDSIAFVPWRKRPDNLYGMSPLANLVGMQYRLDHLENLKADALDLLVHPPLKVVGDVEPFRWGPGEKIFLPMDGDVSEVATGLNGVITAQNNIDIYMAMMEELAGAPRQAMGIRTPGEKTAFEVQSLDNAAGRIFQEKVSAFERNIIEPLLNAMFALGRQNLEGAETVTAVDEDLGVSAFLSITKEDITGRGKLRPIGARHFSQQAQFVQNLNNLLGGPIGQAILPHISSVKLAEAIEGVLQFNRFDLVRENVALVEQAEAQKMVMALQAAMTDEQSVPPIGESI